VGKGKNFDKILLEGGSAFGTGDHPTARLCGQWLLEEVCKKDHDDSEMLRLMDYGAGSGILGLIGLLAAKRDGNLHKTVVEGVEVDPTAIEAARRNGLLNGYNVPDQIEFYAPMRGAPGSDLWDQITGVVTDLPTLAAGNLPDNRLGTYDIVICNLIAEPLINLASTLNKLAKKDKSRIALSGVQLAQVEAVLDAYKPYFSDMKMSRTINGWALLEGSRGAQ
jgi:ribosomal protein L11 methyltransferase